MYVPNATATNAIAMMTIATLEYSGIGVGVADEYEGTATPLPVGTNMA